MKKADFEKSWCTPGTPFCTALCTVAGALIALLWLWLGFWKMLFVVLFAALGGICGGVADKRKAFRDLVNRRFPAKDEPIREENAQEPAGTQEIRKIVKQLKDEGQQTEEERDIPGEE